jgi:hypothetical protein
MIIGRLICEKPYALRISELIMTKQSTHSPTATSVWELSHQSNGGGKLRIKNWKTGLYLDIRENLCPVIP